MNNTFKNQTQRTQASVMKSVTIPVVTALLLMSLTLNSTHGQNRTRAASVDEDEGRYQNRYALLIGINYKGSKAVCELKNAESDATRIASVLKDNYGFDCEVLSGDKATKDGILEALDRYRDNVKKNDCFLFYFAGHGERDGLGYIYPSDIKARNGKADSVSGLLCANIVSRVQLLNARHSLLVLDSCFSGKLLDQIQDIDVRTAEEDPSDSILPKEFKSRGLQALTSAASDQKAADGDADSENSPFANVLVNALADLGQTKGSVFTTRKLAAYMNLHFENPAQQPQFSEGKIVDEVGGQFHFFVEKPLTLVRTSRIIAQTLTGTPGSWWFDEMPWLTPAARQILDGSDEPVLFPDSDQPLLVNDKWPDLSSDSTYVAIRDRVKTLTKRDGGDIPQTLHKLLSFSGPRDAVNPLAADAISVMQIVGNNIGARTRSADSDMSATDWHLRALLEHKLDNPEAHAAYEQAETLYTTSERGLKARCLADHAQLLISRGEYEPARIKLLAARSAIHGLDASPFFEVEVLSGLAMSTRKLQQWETADSLYQAALKIVDTNHVDPNHAARAHLFERLAWNCMDQWKVEDAGKYFAQACAVWDHLDKVSENSTMQPFLRKMHVEHGLAMTSRLRGNCAIDSYTAIQKELQDRLESGRGKREREELYERLLNTTERKADCYFLDGRRGMEKALTHFRKAIQYTKHISESRIHGATEQLACKTVIAATLSGQSRDLRTALRMLDVIDEHDKKVHIEGTARKTKSIYRQLADAFAKLNAEDEFQLGLDEIRMVVRLHAKKKLSRDQQELLLLSAEVASEEQRRQDARLLETLVPDSSNGASAFFRGRRDRIIGMKATLVSNEHDFDELVEMVQKVKKPSMRFLRLELSDPMVIFHFPAHGMARMLIRSPQMDPEWDVVQLNFGVQAVTKGLTDVDKAEVNQILTQHQVPDDAQVGWNDDAQRKLTVDYPFSVPKTPQFIEQ